MHLKKIVCVRDLERAGFFLLIAKHIVKLSLCAYILLSRGQPILLHIYVPFKTREGGWGHPSWPCPCLAFNLPWSLFSLGISLKK